MVRSLLIGLLAGARSLTPLAVVADAARRGRAGDGGAAALLGRPVVSAGAALLAAGEAAGDKLPSAPDRIILPGIAARIATGGLAGAALAPRSRQVAAAILGAAGAVGGAYLTFAARRRAMRRFGQIGTGLVEDALTLGGAWWIARGVTSGGEPTPRASRRPSP